MNVASTLRVPVGRIVLQTMVERCVSSWPKLNARDPSASLRVAAFASAVFERLAGATGSCSPGEPHAHSHRHDRMLLKHPHYPDAHLTHRH